VSKLLYEFEAKLDTGGFGRSIRIRENGSFRMDGKNWTNEINNDAPQPET